MNDFDCDIIIITWNGLDYTKKCVESVEKFLNQPDENAIIRSIWNF